MRIDPSLRTARHCVVAILAALCLGGATRPAAAESFVIEFAPRNGETWTKSTWDRRAQDYADVAPATDQVTEIETRQTYVSQPDGSWRVRQQVRDIGMTMNGEAIDTPMFPLIMAQPIELVLNSGGNAVDVEGFRSLMRSYERELDPQTYQSVRQTMKISNLVKGEVMQWNRALEGVRGIRLTKGDRVGVRSMSELQGQLLPVSGVIEVGDTVEVDGETGVRLTYRYDSSGEVLAAAGELPRTIQRFEGEEPARLEMALKILGTLEFVVVPESGQLLSEHMKETIFAPIPQHVGKTARVETEIRVTWRRASSGDS